VLRFAVCAWMCCMCLGVLHVLGCVEFAWRCYMCLDLLYVLGGATCAWMCCMCLDVLHVLGCVVCAWMHFYSQATDRSPSTVHQLKATSILVT